MNINDIIAALDDSGKDAILMMERLLEARTQEINRLVAEKNVAKLRELMQEEQNNLTRLKIEYEKTAAVLNNLKHLKTYIDTD
ncbi:hypothetical protein [Legionella nagasakiensis]|uniref:hypothetical protein n=1 Tax=Legionella nagasakiensis TaxID=535290 RepID=UPI001056277D|nr:hypothetical protein [Legionella nagasakiensis]